MAQRKIDPRIRAELDAARPALERKYPIGSQWLIYSDEPVIIVGYFPTKYQGWQVIVEALVDGKRSRNAPRHLKPLRAALAKAGAGEERK